MSIAAYKSVSLNSDVSSANPHRLVQMLFEGALSKLSEAKGAIERKDLESRSALLSKVIAIIMELSGSLDKEKGGELSENLDDLYLYMREQLMYANLHSDTARIDEVHQLLLELKEAWDQIPLEARGAAL